jgi:hypothetical protein
MMGGAAFKGLSILGRAGIALGVAVTGYGIYSSQDELKNADNDLEAVAAGIKLLTSFAILGHGSVGFYRGSFAQGIAKVSGAANPTEAKIMNASADNTGLSIAKGAGPLQKANIKMTDPITGKSTLWIDVDLENPAGTDPFASEALASLGPEDRVIVKVEAGNPSSPDLVMGRKLQLQLVKLYGPSLKHVSGFDLVIFEAGEVYVTSESFTEADLAPPPPYEPPTFDDDTDIDIIPPSITQISFPPPPPK